jgi:hypothetical protein
MAGGGGVEWYFGYNYEHGDLNCEDWRSRDLMWDQTRIALEFFHQYLPFYQMENHDELASKGYCLADPGSVYALYLPGGGTATVDLSDQTGTYSVTWFDPRNGGALLEGSLQSIEGGTLNSVGIPPDSAGKDWVCLIRAVSK